MARKSSKRSAKPAKKTAAKRGAAKKSAARRVAPKKPARKTPVKESAAKARSATKTKARSATKNKTRSAPKTTARKTSTRKTPPKSPARKSGQPRLLSGGNPQIAKGDGDEPIKAYIDAMPGWKRDIGRRLDALVARTVPNVHKAVKWNSPLYGIEGQGWFIGVHCFAKYIKVAFFRGASLRPLPPGESTQDDVRYLDIHEDDSLDEAQFVDWVKQASKLPGERM